MNILSPSILAADFTNLGREIKDVDDAGARYLHIDVMDGVFVPSISFGMPLIKSIRAATDIIFDVHLMIMDPIRYIKDFVDAGADLITFHIEATENPEEVIKEIRKYDKKVGISIKPNTPVSTLDPYLDKVDMILVMTVEPGFGGQKFIPATYDKVVELRNILKDKKLERDIEVDGGINLDNVKRILDAGANVIVAGSAVFRGDAADNTKRFLDILHN